MPITPDTLNRFRSTGLSLAGLGFIGIGFVGRFALADCADSPSLSTLAGQQIVDQTDTVIVGVQSGP
jgi:hypothetical protein